MEPEIFMMPARQPGCRFSEALRTDPWGIALAKPDRVMQDFSPAHEDVMYRFALPLCAIY